MNVTSKCIRHQWW